MGTDIEPILEARGISKAYGHVQALSNVNFVVYPHEILALVGDNGAGKSTLIKIISGVYTPDEGEIFVKGEKVAMRGPRDAARAGIATVYQDLALVDTRDVAANIFLGREFTVGGGIFVNRAKGLEEAQKVLDRLHADLPSVKVTVGQLSGGQRQAVAISRALAQGGEIFIMDEPTAALGVAEAAEVLRLVTELKEQGAAVIIISHNLQHVFSVAERITVLRHGQIVGSPRKDETTMEKVVQMIVGARSGIQPATD